MGKYSQDKPPSQARVKSVYRRLDAALNEFTWLLAVSNAWAMAEGDQTRKQDLRVKFNTMCDARDLLRQARI